MERLYSKIIGMPVFTPDSLRPIYNVRDLIFDPVNGAVIAFEVGRGLVITPMDVLSMKQGILIKGMEDVVGIDDILRVRKVVDEGMGIMGKKVVTLGGKALGKVVDLTIDDGALILNKIYTAKVILGVLQRDSRVIPAKNIVEVLSDRIVVKNDSGEVTLGEVEGEEREVVGAVEA
ncbi:MAG: PRC-barrel domain-containing protein [Candidatus Gracilibacteria bacterium]